MASLEEIELQVDMINRILPLANELTSEQLNKLLKTLQRYEIPLTPEEERVFSKIERFVLKASNELLLSREEADEKSSSLFTVGDENSTPKDSQPEANSASPLPEPPLPHEDRNLTQDELSTEILELKTELNELRLNERSSEETAMKLEFSEFEEQISALQTKNKVLQQQYEDELRDNMDKERQILELQQSGKELAELNDENERQISELNEEVSQLMAEQQSWENENLKNSKINDLFTQLEINLEEVEKTNKLVLEAQPKSLSVLSQSILQLREENGQLIEELKDKTKETNFDIINEQIEKYQDYMPQCLSSSRVATQPEPFQQQSNLASEISKICQSFRPRAVQLERAGDKQWVYERTGALLEIDFSDRGNVVITKEGGVDIKPVLLSQYLRTEVMGLSRSGSAIQSRSESASRSPSENGRALELSQAVPEERLELGEETRSQEKAAYTAIRK